MSFSPKYNLVEELRWRGLLHDIMPGTEELLQKQMVKGYIGFDPTADSLHIGNMVPVTLLYHLQKAGHKPYALVGGATGMVGDPSGKSDERKLLDDDTLQKNLQGQMAQLKKFLDFENGENKAEMVNNYDWFKNIGFLEFIRDVGKHISVNYMMSKDSVKSRLEGSGMSFTEFTYQLVQGYDFYYLYTNNDVKLQMGGSDQWGNIVTGTELIRRKGGGEAFALTAPLITKSDGSKFGKSEGGNIWLDPKKTSPFAFYQYWLNVADADAEKCFKIFSLKNREEIEALIAGHKGNEHMRSLQKEFAREMTTRIHSAADCELAMKATEILFGNGSADELRALDLGTLESSFESMGRFSVSRGEFNSGMPVLDLVAGATAVFPSKGEAKKMIQAGGFSLNKEKLSDPGASIVEEQLLHNKYLIFQKGKKNYFVVSVD